MGKAAAERAPAGPSRARGWVARASGFAASNEFRWLLIILVMSASFRMTWSVYADRAPQGLNDPTVYYVLAHRIADGDGYTRTTGETFAYYPVGFPFVIGVLFWGLEHTPVPNDYILAAKVMNGVLGLLTTGLVYLLGRRLFSATVGLAAAFLHAAFPSQVFYTGTLLSEALFTFLVMLALTVLLWSFPQRQARSTPWFALIAGGLLLGAATLTRGITLFVPLLLFFLWWASSRRPGMAAAHAAIVFVGIMVFVVPWSVRNTVLLGSPVLISTNIGDDLCIGHHEGGQGKFVLTGPCFDKLYEELPADEAEVRRNRDGVRKAVSYALRNPVGEITVLYDKAYWLLGSDRDGTWAAESYGNDLFIERGLREGLGFWANLYYYGVMAWAVLAAPLVFLTRDLRRLGLGLSILYLLAMPLVFFGDPRFHFPAIPQITIVAAAGVVAVVQPARERLRADSARATGLQPAS